MAFAKTISHAGFDAGYLQLSFLQLNRRARECSAHWSLFKDRASARNGERPLVEIAAKLRLKGEDFDTFLAGNSNERLVAKLYEAAKAVSASPATYPLSHVVSDYGSTIFADASDVIE